ncbi:MAG: hypothetical protein KC619_22895, partial [Myxococcales bacterium]|nr:hypothetical protein [Myxococcales bacterium]
MHRLDRLVLPFLCALLFAGCDCGGAVPGDSCTTDTECDTGERCVDGRCVMALPGMDAGDRPGFDAGPPGPTIESVRLEPASASLTSVDGSRPTQTFMAVVTYSDGTEGPAVAPSFSLDSLAIGDVDGASGEFTANGFIGGTAMVHVSVPAGGGTLSADATVSVTLERVLRGDGITDADVALFGTATPVDDGGRSAGIVYPLDGVVMPQNVYPADVQWTRSVDGDLFRVTITKPGATVTAYLRHDPLMHWLVDEAAWRSIAQTGPGEPATLTVDRLEAASGELVRGTPVSMTFAQAALAGTVYYWDIVRGRIVRIDDGTATRVEFMPNPPAGPADGNRCVGCHSVSNSG